MLRGHAVAVGHALLNLGNVFVGQNEVRGNNLTQIQYVGSNRVDLFGSEGLGVGPWHGPVNVIPERRDRGHLHKGGSLWEIHSGQVGDTPRFDIGRSRSTCDGREDIGALAKHPMARSAFGLPNILAFCHRAGTCWQALEIRSDIDIPGFDLCRRGRAANALECSN